MVGLLRDSFWAMAAFCCGLLSFNIQWMSDMRVA